MLAYNAISRQPLSSSHLCKILAVYGRKRQPLPSPPFLPFTATAIDVVVVVASGVGVVAVVVDAIVDVASLVVAAAPIFVAIDVERNGDQSIDI